MAFSRTEQLLAYVAKLHPEATVTVLMKIAYLTDLSSIAADGRRISRFKYVRYNYGPFDQEIYKFLQRLVLGNILTTEAGYGLGGSEYLVYRFNPAAPTGKFNFRKLEKFQPLIDQVLKGLSGYGAKTLTTIAYKTRPMLALGATLGGTEHMNKRLNLRAK